MFFDDHPEFLETSTTAIEVGRLNLRHLAIIDAHRDLLKGARVLDIASHDGRWSFAALEAGAAHVTGIEGRDYLVNNASKTITEKGIDPSRFNFVVGDAHDALTAGVGEFDVVMCLGFMYHTLRYPELLAGIKATKAHHAIIDSKVLPGKERIIRVINQPTERESMAVEDRLSYQGNSLAGTPTRRAIVFMMKAYGFDLVKRTNWRKLIRREPRDGWPRRYVQPR